MAASSPPAAAPAVADTRAQAALLGSIAENLATVDQIQALIQAQAQQRPELNTSYVAPRTACETQLARMFAELLGVERVGINDSFFDLGGHSLLATQLLTRMSAEFQVEIPMAVLFNGEFTVARLAGAVGKYQVLQAQPEDVVATLKQLDSLTDDEVRALLAEKEDPVARPAPE